MGDKIVIFCTVPTREDGLRVADTLVSERLAACVNIVPGIFSIYRWQGKICRDDELLLIIKTRASLFSEIRDNILSIHPYDVPEVISMEINDGNESYLKWIAENTLGKS